MRYNKLQAHSNMALFKSLGMFLATTPLPHPFCHTTVSSAITSPPLLIYLYNIGSVYSAWPPLHLVVTSEEVQQCNHTPTRRPCLRVTWYVLPSHVLLPHSSLFVCPAFSCMFSFANLYETGSVSPRRVVSCA